MYTTLTDMRLPPKFGEQRLIHLDHIAKTMQKSVFVLLSPGVRWAGYAPSRFL